MPGGERGVFFSVGFVAGKKRHRLDRRSSRMYTPGETVRAEAAIAAACREALGEGAETPVFGPHVPVIVTVDTYRPLPESRPRRCVSEPDTFKPDGDNEAKLVMDALNGLMWHDDCQVVDLHVVKHPRARGAAERMDVRVSPGWTGREEETEE